MPSSSSSSNHLGGPRPRLKTHDDRTFFMQKHAATVERFASKPTTTEHFGAHPRDNRTFSGFPFHRPNPRTAERLSGRDVRTFPLSGLFRNGRTFDDRTFWSIRNVRTFFVAATTERHDGRTFAAPQNPTTSERLCMAATSERLRFAAVRKSPRRQNVFKYPRR